jgi:thioredoxin-related protein
MKKIILILFIISIAIFSCKKEENKPKQTRLKTYTRMIITHAYQHL